MTRKLSLLLSLLLISFVMEAQDFVVSHAGKTLYLRVLDKKSVSLCAPFSSYASPYSGKVVIPAEVRFHRKRYQVVTIAPQAFDGSQQLTQVILPSSLSTIEYQAFRGCSALQQVAIPISVTQIDEGAFSRCASLSQVSVANPQCMIHKAAFDGCDSTLSFLSPSQQAADSVGLLRKEYYPASAYLTSRRLAERLREQHEMEIAGKAGIFREDLRQTMEEQRLKYEEKEGQDRSKRPQVSAPKKRTTTLGSTDTGRF